MLSAACGWPTTIEANPCPSFGVGNEIDAAAKHGQRQLKVRREAPRIWPGFNVVQMESSQNKVPAADAGECRIVTQFQQNQGSMRIMQV